jgi:hypothetical protein
MTMQPENLYDNPFERVVLQLWKKKLNSDSKKIPPIFTTPTITSHLNS